MPDIGEESFVGRGNSKFSISEVGAAFLAGMFEESKEAWATELEIEGRVL